VARKKPLNSNPKAIQTRIQGLINGFGSVYAPGKVIDVAGTSTPVSQIVLNLQTGLGRYSATDAAHTTYEQVKQVRDAATDSTLAYVLAAETGIKANLGDSNPALAQFGLKPKSPRAKRSLEARLESAEKAKATREKKDGSSSNVTPAPASPPAQQSGHVT
jgi:hypothetical protein